MSVTISEQSISQTLRALTSGYFAAAMLHELFDNPNLFFGAGLIFSLVLYAVSQIFARLDLGWKSTQFRRILYGDDYHSHMSFVRNELQRRVNLDLAGVSSFAVLEAYKSWAAEKDLRTYQESNAVSSVYWFLSSSAFGSVIAILARVGLIALGLIGPDSVLLWISGLLLVVIFRYFAKVTATRLNEFDRLIMNGCLTVNSRTDFSRRFGNEMTDTSTGSK